MASTTTGIYTQGVGNGYSATAIADTSTRVIRIYLGAYHAAGTLTASLSDASAPAATVSVASPVAGSTDQVVALSYRANSAGQTLLLNYTMAQAFDATGNVTLQSATLSIPVTATVDDGASAWTYGGGWFAYTDSQAYLTTAHGNQVLGGFGLLTFTGRKVDIYTWKQSGAGTVEVFVDGISQGTRSLDNGGPATYNQLIFSATWASVGSHTVKLLATNAQWVMVDYATVSN